MLAPMVAALPAVACEAPGPLPDLSNTEISRLTANAIRNSDVIVDAIVIRKGEALFLEPIKIWEGRHQRLYELDYSCSQSLAVGSRVRVLLTISETHPQLWHVTEPLVDRRMRSILFDSLLDAHLGQVRPPDYENGGLPYPPLP